MPDNTEPVGNLVVETRLVLVRHGESMAMVNGVVGGHDGCTGLSLRGRGQAEALRDRLASTGDIHADVLLSSILPRAIETAEIIAPALGAIAPSSHCDYCEIHPGESDGMTWADYRANYGFDPRAEPGRPLSPGGESLQTFQARVTDAIGQILADHEGRTVVLVCHGGVIVAATRFLLGVSGMNATDEGPSAGLMLEPEPTSITEWAVRTGDGERDTSGGARPVRVLRRFNDVAHLPVAQATD
jgi:broad specificity phosphatase PhoE